MRFRRRLWAGGTVFIVGIPKWAPGKDGFSGKSAQPVVYIARIGMFGKLVLI